LLFGRSLFVVWLDLLDTGSRLFGLKENAVLWIVFALLAIHMLIGCMAGWLGWNIARQLQTRLGKSQSEDLEQKSDNVVEEKEN
jgi:hypothetical protein